ncbi:MAG: PEGA domain-containing protein [Candidatus Aminicenantes bacterium]|nr:PEGA domain-containing protein [Candidatus Aminicenantes bacterium]
MSVLVFFTGVISFKEFRSLNITQLGSGFNRAGFRPGPIKSGEPPPLPADKDQTVSKPLTQVVAANASAFILLDIKPSGEVYVDGKMMGSSPPMEFVQVTPGRHKIEIKKSPFPVYTQTIDLKPSENIKISHVFR